MGVADGTNSLKDRGTGVIDKQHAVRSSTPSGIHTCQTIKEEEVEEKDKKNGEKNNERAELEEKEKRWREKIRKMETE